ncbi:MAG: hypothetical protein HY606_04415 [Planctomycetes bacterium]|nr:hypothetical protein [Planctomycetota bacterium]
MLLCASLLTYASFQIQSELIVEEFSPKQDDYIEKTITIKGTVYDSDNKPAFGASVEFRLDNSPENGSQFINIIREPDEYCRHTDQHGNLCSSVDNEGKFVRKIKYHAKHDQKIMLFIFVHPIELENLVSQAKAIRRHMKDLEGYKIEKGDPDGNINKTLEDLRKMLTNLDNITEKQPEIFFCKLEKLIINEKDKDLDLTLKGEPPSFVTIENSTESLGNLLRFGVSLTFPDIDLKHSFRAYWNIKKRYMLYVPSNTSIKLTFEAYGYPHIIKLFEPLTTYQNVPIKLDFQKGPAKLCGTCADESGNPLKTVRVAISQEGFSSAECLTDENGRFTIEGILDKKTTVIFIPKRPYKSLQLENIDPQPQLMVKLRKMTEKELQQSRRDCTERE